MRRHVLALAAALALGACTPSATGTVTAGPVTWTAVAAADVETNAALGVVSYLKVFEAQVPNARASVQAAGNALASGVIAQGNTMVAGGSAPVQTKQAAISAVLAQAPSLSALLTTKQSGSGSAITVAADAAALLVDDASYVLPAAAAAGAGTITATTLGTDQAALQAAAAAL